MQPTNYTSLDELVAKRDRTVAVVYRHPGCGAVAGDDLPVDAAVFVDGHRRDDGDVEVQLLDPDAPGQDAVDITVRVAGQSVPARLVLVDPGAGYDAADWAEFRDYDAAYALYPAAAEAVRQFYAAGARTEHVR